MRGSRLEVFKQHQDIQQWQNSTYAHLLVLVGYNNHAKHRSRYCWMSPFALHLIEEHQTAQSADMHAFCIVKQSEPHALPNVLSSIIFQLLLQNRRALRDENQTQELHRELRTISSTTDTDLEEDQDSLDTYQVGVLQRAAVRVLSMLDPNKVIWIIIDRADRCNGRSKFDYQKRLLQALVYIVENTDAKVKILSISNGHDGTINDRADELGQTKGKNRVTVHVCRQNTG